jgi:hypothetical protein
MLTFRLRGANSEPESTRCTRRTKAFVLPEGKNDKSNE